jgi:K+/H+ antiporter YhaU regulatory subunit KhtT
VLVLAVRGTDGAFRANPNPDTVITAGDVVIAVGTSDSLAGLSEALA